jgi:hypothetical protein
MFRPILPLHPGGVEVASTMIHSPDLLPECQIVPTINNLMLALTLQTASGVMDRFRVMDIDRAEAMASIRNILMMERQTLEATLCRYFIAFSSLTGLGTNAGPNAAGCLSTGGDHSLLLCLRIQ